MLAAARAETVGSCYTDYVFSRVVTHVAYSPDFVRPHSPAMTSARRWLRSNRDGDRDAKNCRTSCFLRSQKKKRQEESRFYHIQQGE